MFFDIFSEFLLILKFDVLKIVVEDIISVRAGEHKGEREPFPRDCRRERTCEIGVGITNNGSIIRSDISVAVTVLVPNLTDIAERISVG